MTGIRPAYIRIRLIRIRAEQGKVTCGRAAIDKAFLIQNYKWKEGEALYGSVDVESARRLHMCWEDYLQFWSSFKRMQIQGINTTIRDRYFNSACATPASVFPVLIKLKNSHIKKLERDSPEEPRSIMKNY